ncbi:phage tail tape measure protein, partial [Klebsiella pneumoniae]|nr:phage tail tape measure protein [Klebsiella pneumoniae]
IVGIVAAIAPALKVGGKLIKVIGSVTSVIGTVVGVLGGPLTLAIGAVIAVGVLLWKNWDKIKAAAQNLFTNLKATWNNIKSTITS